MLQHPLGPLHSTFTSMFCMHFAAAAVSGAVSSAVVVVVAAVSGAASSAVVVVVVMVASLFLPSSTLGPFWNNLSYYHLHTINTQINDRTKRDLKAAATKQLTISLFECVLLLDIEDEND